jgi:hypothetical protein
MYHFVFTIDEHPLQQDATATQNTRIDKTKTVMQCWRVYVSVPRIRQRATSLITIEQITNDEVLPGGTEEIEIS